MEFSFPLFLVLSVFATGSIWLLEIFYLAPQRKSRIASVQKAVDQDIAEETSHEFRQPLLVEYSISFFPVLLLVLILRSFLYEPFQIPSGSMIPTLKVGDFILVNKFAYGIRLPVIGTKVVEIGEPQRGDVMVFIPPHEPRYYIKRVIGVPGDKVRYTASKMLYINGVEQKLEYVERLPAFVPSALFSENLGDRTHLIHRELDFDKEDMEWTVPEGKYFMMGDNRDNSKDSRSWGMASEENIVGKAVAIWMNWIPGFQIPDFSRNGTID